jgi:hypothetical protein
MGTTKDAEKRLYLIDFLRGFMEYSEEKRSCTTSFPPLLSPMAWHVFFWVLKRAVKKFGGQLPFETGSFDWDGEYPKSPILTECLGALLIICSVRPFDGRLVLEQRLKDSGKENRLVAESPELAELAHGVACQIQGFFEN